MPAFGPNPHVILTLQEAFVPLGDTMRHGPSRTHARDSILLGLALLGALGALACNSVNEVILFIIDQNGSTSEDMVGLRERR